MNIDKTKLYLCWFEDEDGNKVDALSDINITDKLDLSKKWTYHSMFPCQLEEHIDMYNPNLKYTNSKLLKRLFPKRYGSTFNHILTGTSSWNPQCVMAMVKSGDFTLEEAIIVYANSCEKCINVLWNKYVSKDEGYPEFSFKWKVCGTSCEFCRNVDVGVLK